MKILATIVFCLTLQSSAFSAEVDHYSISYEKIDDSAYSINERANLYIEKAIASANAESPCEESVLYKELQHYFANHANGELGADLLEDKDFERTVIPLAQSIYREWSPFNGFLLGRKKARTSPLALGPIMRLGENIVQTDKFEHMFGMGFKYFNKHYLKGKDLTSVLKGGVFLEKTALGGNILATGVFSYGDLAANFNGMRFWNHMLAKYDDVLGSEYNLGPYISCDGGRWVKKEYLDFRNYMDKSMDESLNCSKFATKSGLAKVKKQLNILSKTRKLQACLHSPKETHLERKYGVVIKTDSKKRTISHWILNYQGHGKVSYFREFKD